MARFSAIIISVIGLLLCVGGGFLVALGGSWYYLICGLAFLATGVALYRHRPVALLIYAAILAGTLIWAIYEVGFDWWQLAPRGGIIVLIGLWLIAPWTTRALSDDDRLIRASAHRGAGLVLTVTLLVSVVVAVYAMLWPANDLAGTLPAESVAGLDTQNVGIAVGDWPSYGRTPGGNRYSPLAQITPANAAQLTKAWTYNTGDIRSPDDSGETTYEVTPTKIGDTLYLCTAHNIAIALDPVTGTEKWRFDPKVGRSVLRQHQTCRGVSYYRSPNATAGAACSERIILPTADAKLYALDASNGQICAAFGQNGAVDLWANMPDHSEGAYYSTSPPAIARNLIIVGGAVNDNVSTSEPSGVIRAYNAETGQLVWNFDSGNPERTQPIASGETYTKNSPNSWSILSVDPELGLVYAPMGNAPPDQFGGDRSENTERFSASVTALDLDSGQARWVFQTVHHDLWDMDVPAQPQLVTIRTGNGDVPGLVQATKQGEIYVLDRRTGTPILPVTEQPAPQGAADGDRAAPTQPVSAISFNPPPLRERDMWGATMFDQLACRIAFQTLRYEGRFTPPSMQGTIVYPGNFGAFNWGGVAVDPVRQLIVATPVRFAFTVKLIPRKDATTNYVSDGKPGLNENYGSLYAAQMQPFTSPLGLRIPCQAPPWGNIAGIDLRTGKTVWQHKNGTVRDLSPVPLPFKLGVPNIGGPITTAGGVTFLSGTLDYFVRAYEVTSGKEIWRDRLPAGGQATPMTYQGGDGRQYLVVVAGGHGSTNTKAGDAIIAYALPK